MTEMMIPVSPGEMLAEEFLNPIGMSKYRIAKSIGVPAQRIGGIIAGKRGITAGTDLRLCRFFVSVRSCRSAADRVGLIVSALDSGHYGVLCGAAGEAALV